ncbi:MAG: hypothetical protein H7328_06545 [Bdellovibrio sp.]|nr:hypothetical protein [Bdellovibrio sp.]
MNTLSLVLILLGSFSQASEVQINLKKVRAYQFVHCVPSNAQDSDLVVHQILETKKHNFTKLYVTSGLKTTKAAELKDLSLIENTITQTATGTHDITFSSTALDLNFGLNIADDGGQTFLGVVTESGRMTAALTCHDVTLEK